MKTFFNFTFFVIVLGMIPLGFFYQENIREYVSNYSPMMHLCATVFFAGLSYSLITKNIVILAITIACTIAIPYMQEWFVVYWKFNPIF